MLKLNTAEMVVDHCGDYVLYGETRGVNPGHDGDFPMYVKVDGEMFTRWLLEEDWAMYGGDLGGIRKTLEINTYGNKKE